MVLLHTLSAGGRDLLPSDELMLSCYRISNEDGEEIDFSILLDNQSLENENGAKGLPETEKFVDLGHSSGSKGKKLFVTQSGFSDHLPSTTSRNKNFRSTENPTSTEQKSKQKQETRRRKNNSASQKYRKKRKLEIEKLTDQEKKLKQDCDMKKNETQRNDEGG